MASAVVAIAIGIGALTGRDDDVNVTTKPEPSTTAPEADDDAVEPFKPAAPGSVVLTPPRNDTPAFAELQTFGPDGQPGDTLSLAPI